MRLPPPITSRTNAKVKALRAALSGEPRKPGDLVGLEGEHLIQEAHSAGMSFEAVFVRAGKENLLLERELYANLRTKQWVVLAAEVFDGVVSTVTPQGVVALWAITPPVRGGQRHPVTLLLEHLQDPGNLGTLIRTMHGFGMERVVISPQTVNQWSPKVLRSSAGASFRVPVERRPLADAVAELKARGVRVFAAVASFVAGEEYGGFPKLLEKNGVLTGRKPSDRMEPGAGSPWPLIPLGASAYDASLSYDTDFEEPCAILIGNEGAGLSQEARMLADEQVMIPGVNESINAAVAGSILLYEVMRQGPLRQWARKQGLRP